MEQSLSEISRRFPAAAEYLSGIFILKRDYGVATNTRLAGWLGVSGSAVTQALGRLKRLNLARQKRYDSIDLTDHGMVMARTVLRRHYIIEHVLVRILDYPWDKADDEAKGLQTQISEDLTEHLYRKLGNPQTCPHGNPLPGTPQEERLLKAPTLDTAQRESRLVVLRITEEGEGIPAMLEFCYRHGVQPGARFLMGDRDTEALRLRRLTSPGPEPDGEPVSVPLAFARHIRYESLP